MEKIAETKNKDGLVHLIGDFFAHVETEGITVARPLTTPGEELVLGGFRPYKGGRSFEYISDRRGFEWLSDAYKWAARAYVRECQMYGTLKPVEPRTGISPGSYHRIEDAYCVGDEALKAVEGWSERGNNRLKELRGEN